MGRIPKALALAATLLAGPASGHEKGSDRAMGVVDGVTPERIAIRTSDGHVVEFAVTPATRFSRGKTRVSPAHVHAGDRAVVHGARRGDGLAAVEVKLAPATPPR